MSNKRRDRQMGWKKSVEVLCFCGIVLIGTTACEDAKTPWEMHVATGELRMQQGRFGEAEVQLKAALHEAE